MARIIITGVSRGIGRALVEFFLSTGDHQVIGLSRERTLPHLPGDSGGTPGDPYIHIATDPDKPSDFSALEAFLRKGGIRPDILINNAGLMLHKPYSGVTGPEFDRVMEVNVKMPFMLIRLVAPLMSNPGHIVNITSMGGVMGSVKFPGLSIYSASKGALSILTEALAEELKDTGIRVNALALGSVQTEMLAEAFPGYQAPVGPGEMAGFIGNFALTGHRYFNGKVLPVAVTTP